MAMVNSGPISLAGNATTSGLNQSVNIELNRAATASINMNESAVRTLAAVPSGAISMSNFYGKANQFSFSISSNTTNLDLRSAAISAGWNGSSAVVATINSGIYVHSTSTGSYALTISGSFPGGVSLTNNGVIVGKGGTGSTYRDVNTFPNVGPGGNAGPALFVSTAVTINNASGRIAGGGGGGGAGGYYAEPGCFSYTGGGGGGGIGNGNADGGFATGTAGTLTAAGSGGSSGEPSSFAGTGGAGGGYGSAGSSGVRSGSMNYGPGPGGAAGACIVGNSNITYINTGTRNGSIS